MRPRSEVPGASLGYGLGLWLEGETVFLEGLDAGVSFRTVHRPGSGATYTVVSNTSDGAWPLVRFLRDEAT